MDDDLEQLATLREWAFPSRIPVIGPLISRIREIWYGIAAKWAIRALITQQSEFNRQLLTRLSALEYSTIENDRAAMNLYRQVSEVQRHLAESDRAVMNLNNQISEVQRHVAESDRVVMNLNNQVAATCDSHVKIDERIARLERWMRRAESGLLTRGSSTPPSPTGHTARPTDDDFDYFAFELKFRGSISHVKESFRQYLQYFVDCDDVVDLGCGRGEFIELLREQGIQARGVDMSFDMIEACRARGLNAVQMDVFEYLALLPDESLGGIFSAHLVEHLTPADLVRLINLCYQKLRPSAPLVIETPNPMCLLAMATHFILDPTHIRPVHPEILQFLFDAAGFRQMTLIPSSPTPEELRLQRVPVSEHMSAEQRAQVEIVNRNVDRLNDLLYGFQNYAIVARKAPAKLDEKEPQQAIELPASNPG